MKHIKKFENIYCSLDFVEEIKMLNLSDAEPRVKKMICDTLNSIPKEKLEIILDIIKLQKSQDFKDGKTPRSKYTNLEYLKNKNISNLLTIKDKWEEISEDVSGGGAYPGPSIVNQASSTLAAGASDGMIGGGHGFGQTGAMGGEYPKKYAPSRPEKIPHKQNIKSLTTKETKKRKNAIKKLMKLDQSKMKTFDEFENEKK